VQARVVAGNSGVFLVHAVGAQLDDAEIDRGRFLKPGVISLDHDAGFILPVVGKADDAGLQVCGRGYAGIRCLHRQALGGVAVFGELDDAFEDGGGVAEAPVVCLDGNARGVVAVLGETDNPRLEDRCVGSEIADVMSVKGIEGSRRYLQVGELHAVFSIGIFDALSLDPQIACGTDVGVPEILFYHLGLEVFFLEERHPYVIVGTGFNVEVLGKTP